MTQRAPEPPGRRTPNDVVGWPERCLHRYARAYSFKNFPWWPVVPLGEPVG